MLDDIIQFLDNGRDACRDASDYILHELYL
jgi:hypothetical protein